MCARLNTGENVCEIEYKGVGGVRLTRPRVKTDCKGVDSFCLVHALVRVCTQLRARIFTEREWVVCDGHVCLWGWSNG